MGTFNGLIGTQESSTRPIVWVSSSKTGNTFGLKGPICLAGATCFFVQQNCSKTNNASLGNDALQLPQELKQETLEGCNKQQQYLITSTRHEIKQHKKEGITKTLDKCQGESNYLQQSYA